MLYSGNQNQKDEEENYHFNGSNISQNDKDSTSDQLQCDQRASQVLRP